jgi:GPH family glycoside/pentoside/hexuronide:cation symporter
MDQRVSPAAAAARSSGLPPGRQVGYGVGVYGIFLVWMMTAVTLMNFYTEVLGLTAAQAGTIFLVASIWDAVTDPVMGWLNDRVRTRWGRYRPWLLFAAPPFALAFLAMFAPPPVADPASLFALALALHLLFRTTYTAVYMPYTAMIARLSTSARERAQLAGVKNMFTAGAALTISFFAFDSVAHFGGGDDARGFRITAILIAAVSVAALWLCFVSTREPPSPPREAAAGLPLSATLSALAANRAFWLIFFGVIAFTGCYTMINKSIVYDAQWNLGDRTLARYPLTAIALAGILSPLLWVPVSKASSKRTVWIAGCLIAALALALIWLLPDLALWPRTALFFAAGVGIHAVLMTFFAAVADAADHGEWKTGVRVEALLFGCVSFANKVSLGLGSWALGLGLDAAGYVSGGGSVEGAGQTPETLAAITLWMTLVPAAGFLLSAAIIVFFPVSNAVHARVEAELKARGSLGA